MRFLSNTHDPADPDARRYQVLSFRAWDSRAAAEFEWLCYLEWIALNIIGRAKATATWTRAQLEDMGLVGVYSCNLTTEQRRAIQEEFHQRRAAIPPDLLRGYYLPLGRGYGRIGTADSYVPEWVEPLAGPLQ